MEWYPFDKSKGSDQKLPPIKKWVLGKVKNLPSEVDPIVVCYRNDMAGDAECPYFITPGYRLLGGVYEWCDCLMDGFDPHPTSADAV